MGPIERIAWAKNATKAATHLSDTKVVAVLAWYSNANTSEAFPSLETIRQHSGLAQRHTVVEALNRLVDGGWIQRLQRGGPGRGSTRYKILATNIPKQEQNSLKVVPRQVPGVVPGQVPGGTSPSTWVVPGQVHEQVINLKNKQTRAEDSAEKLKRKRIPKWSDFPDNRVCEAADFLNISTYGKQNHELWPELAQMYRTASPEQQHAVWLTLYGQPTVNLWKVSK